MAFLGNLVRSFLSSEVPPEAVQEVNIASYSYLPVIAREEGLILYGPTDANKYELLLQQPIEANRKTAFSLFRLTNRQSAQDRFVILRDVLVPMCSAPGFNLFTQRQLQELMNLQKEHPTWRSAHLATKLGLHDLLVYPAVAQYVNTAELDFRETPMLIAIQEENVACITALMQLNVSFDVVDCKGNSVYHHAATTNKIIIELIMNVPHNFLLNAPNNAGKTPLHLACEADKPECVTALLAAGADVNVASTLDSTLAIHTAIVADSDTCAKEILKKHPNMLHVQDMKMGGTPLHWAKSKNMVNALVELNCHINAKNFEGRTALHLMTSHDRLDCVLALLSHGASPHLTDNHGNTPLHYTRSLSVLHAFLVFEAPFNKENENGETPRHVIATSKLKDKNAMLHALHALGAKRCLDNTPSCSTGCSPLSSFDGIPSESLADARQRGRSQYDTFLDEAMCGLGSAPNSTEQHRRGGRMLCLDGGGIRGLVLIILIRAIQRHASDIPVNKLFDWIAGTSTGAILALALAMGRSPQYALSLYFKLKDEVFKGSRPYPAAPLEEVLKREFGNQTVMSDIKDVKVVVTGVLADRYPADLHLFRNYYSGEELLGDGFRYRASGSSLSSDCGSSLIPTLPPSRQLVWEAARSSGAAPSYFKAYGRFIDGGLIANNPSLDLLTEVCEHNAVLSALGKQEEIVRPSVLLSLGTGKPPLEDVKAIDCFRPESIYGTIQMAMGLSNMAKLLIDQVTMADNHTVDRCRAWCQGIGVKYLRLSPLLSSDIQLDETKDDVLLQMLWEAQVYCVSKENQIKQLVKNLIPVNT